MSEVTLSTCTHFPGEGRTRVQGYLAHKKPQPPRTLQ